MFIFHPLHILVDLKRIVLLQPTILDVRLEFPEFHVGAILEFDHHPDPGEFLVVFSHELQIRPPLGVGALHIP